GLDIARRLAEASGGSLTVGKSAAGGGCVTAGFGPPAGAAGPGRRHRRRPRLAWGRLDPGAGAWPEDPPPWAALRDAPGPLTPPGR
ncbi:MAG: hypothetical protein ACHP9Z_02970, partial [Streptosporangiales bacterium]